MIENLNYFDTLDEAVKENSLLMELDKKNWFYKKWYGLVENENASELWVETQMKRIKNEYRTQIEKANMRCPSAIPFNQFKKFMEKDRLFKVFRAMPKGGLLHVHSAAALSLEGLIDLLIQWNAEHDTVYVVCSKENAKNMIPGTLFFHIPGLDMKGIVTLETFLQREDAMVQLKKWLSLMDVEHWDHITYVWDEFNNIFRRTGELFTNKQFYYEYHKRFFLECLEDNIDYVELRCGFQQFDTGAKDDSMSVYGNSPEFLDVLIFALESANKEAQTRNLRYSRMKLRVILCARRDLSAWAAPDKENLRKKLDTAIVWQQDLNYNRLIAGFDFVSEEDRGQSTYSYYSELFYENAFDGHEDPSAAQTIQAAYSIAAKPRIFYLNLPLHAGESLWNEQDNIVDAKIACRSRIGHGFQMAQYPGVTETYVTAAGDVSPKGPVLEVCPISNQLLRYFPDLRAHTVYQLMKQGVPCVLGNDDPQLLGNPGLAYDFWEFYMASNGSLDLIKGLVFTAYVFQYGAEIDRSVGDLTAVELSTCLTKFKNNYWKVFLDAAHDILY